MKIFNSSLFPISLIYFTTSILIALPPDLNKILQLTHEENYSEASQLIKDFIKENKSDSEAYYIQALIFISQKKFKEGLRSISLALKIKSENPDYYRLKAQIHEELDQIKASISTWEKCLLYSQNSAMKSEAKKHIRHLEENK